MDSIMCSIHGTGSESHVQWSIPFATVVWTGRTILPGSHPNWSRKQGVRWLCWRRQTFQSLSLHMMTWRGQHWLMDSWEVGHFCSKNKWPCTVPYSRAFVGGLLSREAYMVIMQLLTWSYKDLLMQSNNAYTFLQCNICKFCLQFAVLPQTSRKFLSSAHAHWFLFPKMLICVPYQSWKVIQILRGRWLTNFMRMK